MAAAKPKGSSKEPPSRTLITKMKIPQFIAEHYFIMINNKCIKKLFDLLFNVVYNVDRA